MKFDHWGITCGIAAALIVSAAPVQADDFVIPDGVTITNTQHLFTDETGTVQQGGTISVSGDVAIETGDNNTINNDGTIEAGNNYGIRADYNNTINNSGKIEADNDFGIRVDDKNTINNDGTIEADDDFGIHAGDDNTINNYENGTIKAEGEGGIVAYDGNTINNSGIIEAGDYYGIDVGNDNIINNSGTIRAGDDHGISAGIDNTINNKNGSTIKAGDTYGIYGFYGNEINNNGAIESDGTHGIVVYESNTINNYESGTINADFNYGVFAYYGNTINNNGSIKAGRDYGIYSEIGNTINNSGTIEANREGGIYAYKDNTINNSGTIRADDGWFGVYAEYSNTINNSGTIEADDYAIRALTGNTINIYGSVLAGDTASAAIKLGSGNTLNLHQGSRIVGLLDLRAVNEVNLHRGESWLMTISQANPTENTLNTFDAPVAFLNGDLTENSFTVATFDAGITVFAEEDDALADLTGAINSVLRNHLAAGDPGDHLWVQGIAAGRRSGNNGFAGTIDHDLAGAMAGFTASLGPSTRGGLFAGYADAGRENATGNHEVERGSLFGGAHARTDFDGIFANFTVTGGWTDNNSERRIVNNQSVTGFDFADGEYEGWFINPELTAGVEVPFYGLTLVPSASVGYAGLFLDGFQESGSDAGISLAGRDVELLTGRLQLELQNSGSDKFGLWQTAFRVGVLGRSNLGDDDLSGLLASTTAFAVALDDDDNTTAGFVGFDAALSLTPDAQIFLGGEAAFEDNGNNAYSGRIGANMKF